MDIVAAAFCFDNLGITEVVIESLSEGQGTVRCQHGILPIPVPAVANIAAAHRLMLKPAKVNGELVTPTGAAIAAAVRTKESLPEQFLIKAVGLGTGKREYGLPGILRAMVIEEDPKEKDVIYRLETNIDDSTGETLGYVMEQLFEAGARDVFYTPVYMKKNRPAWLLSVICREADIQKLEAVIFRETTTIGIRRTKMERTILAREQKTVSTPFGEIQMKVCRHGGETYRYPEYESLARLCREQGISYKGRLWLWPPNMQNNRNWPKGLFQEFVDQPIVDSPIRLIPHGQIQPGFFVHNALVMGKGIKSGFAVISAHAAFAKTAEAHFAGGKMDDRVIDAGAAEAAPGGHFSGGLPV